MRKMLTLLLSIVCLLALAVPVHAAPAKISVTLDGAALTFDADPFVENDRTLVPIRALSEALGFQVGWTEATQQITLTRGDTTINLWVGSTKVEVNGKSSELQVAVRKAGDRTFVPLRFVAETLGAYVTWDNDSQTAHVRSGKAVAGQIVKQLQKPQDQKSSGTFSMVMNLSGPNIPGGTLSIPYAMTLTSHSRAGEMFASVQVQIPFAPAIETQMAGRNGMLYTKQSATSPWVAQGAYDPNDANSAYGMYGMSGMDISQLQSDMLSAAAVTVMGTTDVDGTKALQVRVDLTSAGLGDAIKQIAAGMPGGSEQLGNLDMHLDRYVMTYVVNPETGFIYDTKIDMAFSAVTPDGTMGMELSGEIKAQPTTEAIQFPADLPK